MADAARAAGPGLAPDLPAAVDRSGGASLTLDLREPPAARLRVGLDIGGTFTDFVVYNPAAGDVLSIHTPGGGWFGEMEENPA